MSTGYNELDEKMSFYADQIRVAAEVDDKRWKNAPLPNGGVDPVNGNAINATAVKTNPDIDAKLKEVKSLLERKINWLKGQWGSFEGTYNQPVRDDEDNYMPLPDYASPDYDPSKLTRLYVADEANWSSNGSKEIYAYIYKDGAGDMAAWKGTKMTYDANLVYKGSDGTNKQGLYYVVIEEKYADGLAIVTNSDESKRYPAANQAGMKLEGVSKLYYTGKVSLSSAESVGYPWSGTLPVIKIATAAEVTKDKQTATEWSVISTKGIESVSPIALEIKGRGSSTWTDFDKKPYKLKFADKVARRAHQEQALRAAALRSRCRQRTPCQLPRPQDFKSSRHGLDSRRNSCRGRDKRRLQGPVFRSRECETLEKPCCRRRLRRFWRQHRRYCL